MRPRDLTQSLSRRLTTALSEARIHVGRRPRTAITAALRGPDWAQANPLRLDRALRRSQELPSGGWYAVGASREVGDEALPTTVAGRRLVLWRGAGGELLAAPEACPHMGASLACARVDAGEIVCPWHGLKLGSRGHGQWRPITAWDDGVLAWVRLDDGDEASDRPYLAPRPKRFVDAVIRVEADCDPEDVIANRLDPWHGASFHPYAFSALKVFHLDDELLKMRVTYRIAGPVGIEVDASFHTPDARTIVMTILDGDGVGSVVETHATPLGDGRTAIVEATLATSDRPGFRLALAVAPLVRRSMAKAALLLWADDAAYAERLAWLRREKAAGADPVSRASEKRGRR